MCIICRVEYTNTIYIFVSLFVICLYGWLLVLPAHICTNMCEIKI